MITYTRTTMVHNSKGLCFLTNLRCVVCNEKSLKFFGSIERFSMKILLFFIGNLAAVGDSSTFANVAILSQTEHITVISV